MTSLDFMYESLNPKNAIDTIKYKIKFRKDHPFYFEPDGLLVACGPQGSGKTLTVVNYVQQLVNFYPKSLLVTNLDIKGIPGDYKVIKYSNLNDLIKYFDIVTNGEYGVIYLVDEIQVLFNALLKRGMSIEVLETISQQRKQRKHIVGTAQVFMKIDKVFREQMRFVISCKKLCGVLQYNTIFNGSEIREESGKVHVDEIKARRLWFHSPKMYENYDTSAVISAYREEFKNSTMSVDAFNQLIEIQKNLKGSVLSGN